MRSVEVFNAGPGYFGITKLTIDDSPLMQGEVWFTIVCAQKFFFKFAEDPPYERASIKRTRAVINVKRLLFSFAHSTIF